MATEETNSQFVCAIDLGGTHLRAATIGRDGHIHFRLKQKTPITEDPLEAVAALIAAVRKCDEQSATEQRSIRMISVVVPGTVNIAAGRITRIPNLPALDSFELR